MKSVLISINPKWCAMIASGDKTVEVRKNRPKLEIPFKCYIYCTKHNNDKLSHWSGKVIGEFVCDTYIKDLTCGHDPITNGAACITEEQAAKYAKGKTLYGWHISDLKIYDTPKELGEFYRWAGWEELRPCENHKKCDFYSYDPLENVEYCTIDYDGSDCPYIRVSKPPQSWMYIDD